MMTLAVIETRWEILWGADAIRERQITPSGPKFITNSQVEATRRDLARQLQASAQRHKVMFDVISQAREEIRSRRAQWTATDDLDA
jgi:hypothetical protein